MVHTLYPLFYSMLSTGALIIILFAQLQRLQNENHPVNYGVLKTLTITTLIMWSVTAYIYIIYAG